MSLASLRGKVLLMTFLQRGMHVGLPAHRAGVHRGRPDHLLSQQSRHVDLVAIVANPVDYSVAYTRAFDNQEGLAGLPNWLFLTGSLRQLRQVWQQLRGGCPNPARPAG